MPYVYTVDLDNIEGVVQAAEWASTYRFPSFVPPEFRVNSVMDRMCALLEDDALCLCPNPLFGDNTTLDWRRSNTSSIDTSMDCRSSSYVQKKHIFPPLDNQTYEKRA